MIMKQLRKRFIGIGEVRDNEFCQISTTSQGFLYEVTLPSGRVYYEVFKRRENKRHNCISYPTSKAFGVWAWTTSSVLMAVHILSSFKIKENGGR